LSFYLILKKIMEDKGLSIPEVARMCGLHDSTVRSAIDRQQKKVELSNAIKYSRGLGVSLEYLNGDTTEKAPTNAEAIHIDSTMRKYAQLDDFGKQAVAAVTDVEYQRCITAPVVELPQRKYRSIDLYAMPASAGTGTFLDSDDKEPIDIPDISEYARVTFAVMVSGDSMSPVYENGDYLLVEGRLSVEDGDIGVFVLNGESYVKTFRRVDGEMPWLESVNQKYSPIYIKSYDKILCCGKVVGKL